jgi:hypothetical protein
VIESSQDVLIVTEGKTDWKYMLSALRYFHGKDEFEDIKEEFFYRFGSEQEVKEKMCGCQEVNTMSDSELTNYLNSLIDARRIDKNRFQLRIGIFDSDNPKVKIVNDKEKKVFSFQILPEGISTEFLFSENEIKILIEGRRLYVGTEFHQKSKVNIDDRSLSLGGDNSVSNKAGKKTIIDFGVYQHSDDNIALSKERFAQAIFNNEIQISQESWMNFKPIFERIRECIEAAQSPN